MPKNYHQGVNSVEVPLTDFAPDVSPTTPGILLDMIGCRPTLKGFEALPSAVQMSDAPPMSGANDTVRGATVARFSDGSACMFAGTAEHLWLYQFPGSTLPGLPPQEWDTGQMFTLGLSARWRFFQFGDDVIAVATGGLPMVPQVAHGPVGALTQFGPLGGVTVAMDDIVTGATTAGTAFMFKGQQWFSSAPGVDNNWTPDIQTLAATGFLYDIPGPITAAAPFYRTVIVWKEQAMWLGTFAGPPNSWSFSLISDITGTRNQEAVVLLPDSIAFLGTDDFYITTGTVPIRIPNGLKEWFFNTADPRALSSVQGWYDPSHSVVCWHFISKVAPFPGVCDMFVEYNVRARRWAKGLLTTRVVPQPAIMPSRGVVPTPSPIFFDETSTPQLMAGPPQNVVLRTGWLGIPGQLTQFLRFRPKYNVYPGVQQLMAYYVNALGQIPPIPALTVPALGVDEWFSLRQTGRYHQVILSMTGLAADGFNTTEIVAVAYEAREAGAR